MRAYQEARFDDLGQRVANDGQLTPKEQREWNTLCVEKQREEDAKPQPWLYGGDMADVF